MVQNFLGGALGNPALNPAARAWTYNAGTSNNAYYTTPAAYVFRRYWQNVASATSTTGAIAQAGVGTQKRRSPFFLDITRSVGGAGVTTMTLWGPSTATVLFDYRQEHLLDGIDQPGLPTINGQAMTQLATSAVIPASDSLGPLDSICFYWSCQFPTIELYAITAWVLTDLSWPASDGGVYDSMGTASPFSIYSAGSISSAGTVNQGLGWAGPYAFYGTGNDALQVGYAGTSIGNPIDLFEQYAVGTAVVNAGTGFSGPAVFYGTSNLGAQYGYAGTTIADLDKFESYGTGAVVSGVTISGGTFWSGPGYIY